MKYSELFDLNEITSVIQINKANSSDGARELVSSFVVTPSLGDVIEGIAIPILNFRSGVESKGIFVVGNYGTGKSHLMSFLSILAQDSSYLENIKNSEWREKLAPIAGNFVVARKELAVGDSSVSIYMALCATLEELAKECGFKFSFEREQVINVKDEFARFMTEFEKHKPQKGALVVFDEVLDFLRGREQQDRVLDLGVLRAVGEFCNESRLRIMIGVQQSLFDSPEFANFAEQVSRIRARFVDLNISKEGVNQLISQHLFQKSEAQKEQIRKLLAPRAKFYNVVATDLERFVSLFPAHPKFIDEFQQVFVAERREILSILSKEAKTLATKDVVSDAPELITSDKYWKHIEADPGLRANPSVKTVLDNVQTIKSKIQSHLGSNENIPSAIRLIEGLAINRLTTPTITDANGLTPAALKDNLLWWTALPSGIADPLFLEQAAKRLLVKIRDAANGQYLAESESSGQWYIDPTRDRDYEQEVYAYNPSKTDVQRSLNEIVGLSLELDAQRVAQGTLWNYSLFWEETQVERPGWLVFGFPSERSTAKPPLDFYVFIVPSKRITGKEDNLTNVDDESYVLLESFPPSKFEGGNVSAEAPDTFLDTLKKYTSAAYRSDMSPHGSTDKIAFENIAKKLQKQLIDEFKSNASEWIVIVHNGHKRTLNEWIRTIDSTKTNFPLKSQFELVSQGMFQARFQEQYPGYPVFSQRISESARPGACESAVQIICQVFQGARDGWAVLTGLGLANEERQLQFDRSEWLKKVKDQLAAKGDNKVLNFSDLFEKKRDEKWWYKGESIEAEYLNVVIVAGVYAGDFILTTKDGVNIDAANVQQEYRSLKDFEKITRLSKPAEANFDLWRNLLNLFGVNNALIASESTRESGIKTFQDKIQTVINELATAESQTAQLPFASEEMQSQFTTAYSSLRTVKDTLESKLVPLNSKAKMRNLSLTSDEFEALKADYTKVRALLNVKGYTNEHQATIGALTRLSLRLEGLSATFKDHIDNVVTMFNSVYESPETLSEQRDSLDSAMKSALKAGISVYQSLHKLYRLDQQGDRTKRTIIESKELKQLNKLVLVTTIPANRLETWRNKLNNILQCPGCTDVDLERSPNSTCTSCGFDPQDYLDVPTATELLHNVQVEYLELHSTWVTQLLNELNDPSVVASKQLLTADAQSVINEFVASKSLPVTISDAFINALNDCFKGVKKKAVKSSEFAKKIAGDGTPLKVEEIRARFEAWLYEQVGTDESSSVRFVLED